MIRKWYPTDYIDEVLPEGFDSPNGWLRPIGDGFFTIKSPYHDDPNEEADRWNFHPIKQTVPVEFCYCDHLSDIEITVHEDGRYSIMKGALDPRANQFMAEGMPETSEHGEIEDFVRSYIENDLEGVAEMFTVKCAYWSDPMMFALKIEGGVATFEQVGTA